MPAGQEVVCDVQMVGTLSTASNTWLWSWESPWVVQKQKKDALAVYRYGKEHGMERLTTAKWVATEEDGWAMTGIAARICPAVGAYRLQNRDSCIFLLLKDIREGKDPN